MKGAARFEDESVKKVRGIGEKIEQEKFTDQISFGSNRGRAAGAPCTCSRPCSRLFFTLKNSGSKVKVRPESSSVGACQGGVDQCQPASNESECIEEQAMNATSFKEVSIETGVDCIDLDPKESITSLCYRWKYIDTNLWCRINF